LFGRRRAVTSAVARVYLTAHAAISFHSCGAISLLEAPGKRGPVPRRTDGSLSTPNYIGPMCGRATYKLTWEEIVALYQLTLFQLALNTRARYNVCPTSSRATRRS
jgi:hypothetical protein